MHAIVDGANVVGSRPDGWWRDRAGAAGRLAAQLVAALADPPALAAALGHPGAQLRIHLVLEGAARAADPPAHPRLTIVRAPADGDTSIVALASGFADVAVLVVTADRELCARVHAAGASTVGPRAFSGMLTVHRT